MVKVHILTILNILLMLTFILFLILLPNPLFSICPFLLLDIGLVIEAVVFARHTNKVHDINSNITIKRPFNSKSECDTMHFFVQYRDGKWTVEIDDEILEFNLCDYSLKKSFIKAYYIRWIYYNWMDRTQKLWKFFHSARINRNVDIYLHFNKENKSKTVCLAKNGKVKVSFLTYWVLISKFYWCWFDRMNRNKKMGKAIGKCKINEDWYLKGYYQ